MVRNRRGELYWIIESDYIEKIYIKQKWVQFCMLYSACELPLFFMPRPCRPDVRGPPMCPSFQKLRNGGHMDVRMDTNKSEGFL